MGYVRMIRSGGLHCSSNAIRYGCKHIFALFMPFRNFMSFKSVFIVSNIVEGAFFFSC